MSKSSLEKNKNLEKNKKNYTLHGQNRHHIFRRFTKSLLLRILSGNSLSTAFFIIKGYADFIAVIFATTGTSGLAKNVKPAGPVVVVKIYEADCIAHAFLDDDASRSSFH